MIYIVNCINLSSQALITCTRITIGSSFPNFARPIFSMASTTSNPASTNLSLNSSRNNKSPIMTKDSLSMTQDFSFL